MREDVKNLLVAKLRSGEVDQVTERLHTDKGMCCLGVLCSIAVEQGVDIEVVYDKGYESWTYDNDSSVLPRSVIAWAGMTDANPSIREQVTVNGRRAGTLAELNDVAGYTFDQIADVIEEQWQTL